VEDVPIFQARLTIAEALLRLEETSRDLRDQLFAIEQMKAQQAASRRFAEAAEIHETPQETAPIEPAREEPVIRRAAPSIATAKPIETVTAPVEEPPAPQAPARRSAPEPQIPVCARAVAEPAEPTPVVKEVAQPPQVSEREIFAPRPLHSLPAGGSRCRRAMTIR
jgi:hypothetical protein